MFDMRRREFITLLGGAAAVWSGAAGAQQGERVRRIGVLMAYAESNLEGQANIAAFREALQKLGWTEGRNIRIALAGQRSTQRRCNDLRRNSSRCNLTLFFRHTHQPLPHRRASRILA
jgi:hypothetical protein